MLQRPAAALLRHFFPPRTTVGDRPFEELDAEFRAFHKRAAGTSFLGFALASVLWTFALSAVGHAIVPRWPNAAFRLLPAAFPFWWLPGGACGFLTTLGLYEYATQRLLGERHAEFDRYECLQRGWDVRPMVPTVLPLIVAFVLGFSLLLLKTFVVFTSSEIIINDFGRFHERHYEYSDVIWVGSAPRVKDARRSQPQVAFRFRDGTTWSTRRDLSQSSLQVKTELAKFVATKSHVRVTELPFLEVADL